MKRRDFMALLGGALASLSHANAEERRTLAIGFLHSASPDPFKRHLNEFRRGLSEGGFVEGRNVAVEYRWAEGQVARLPELAADLVRRKVTLIVAVGGSVSARAARRATSSVPILFIGGPNPVADGLVESLSRPGGNVTGVAVYTSELMPKRVELLHELLPQSKTVALLVNPTGQAADTEIEGVEAAARKTKQNVIVFKASAESDLEATFVAAKQQGADALLVSANAFFTDRRVGLVELAARFGIPTAYPWRDYVAAGGLVSYGPSITGAYKQLGEYATRVLKGQKPGDLPVQMPTNFELVLNLKAAKALGLTVPRIVLVRANELIE